MLKITLAVVALATVSASNFLEFDRLLQVAGTQTTACTTDALCISAAPFTCCAQVSKVSGNTTSAVNKVCAPASIVGSYNISGQVWSVTCPTLLANQTAPSCNVPSDCANYTGTCCDQNAAQYFGAPLVNTTRACQNTSFSGYNWTYNVGTGATAIQGNIVTTATCVVASTTGGANGTSGNGTSGNGTSGSSSASFLQMTLFAIVAVLSVAFF